MTYGTIFSILNAYCSEFGINLILVCIWKLSTFLKDFFLEKMFWHEFCVTDVKIILLSSIIYV